MRNGIGRTNECDEASSPESLTALRDRIATAALQALLSTRSYRGDMSRPCVLAWSIADEMLRHRSRQSALSTFEPGADEADAAELRRFSAI